MIKIERGKFIKFFNKASDHLDRKRLKRVIKRSVSSSIKMDLKDHEYIIVMEELSELSQQVSKAARGRLDKVCLVEEMADVVISIAALQELCGVETLDLYKAINVKLDRKECVLNTEGVYL